jgi:soluble lytic murein transglycosylase-like protein
MLRHGVRLVSYGRIILPQTGDANLKKNANRQNPRAAGLSASRRNSFATVIRSRTVQGVLVLAAGLQGTALVARHQQPGSPAAAAAPSPLSALGVPAELVAPPVVQPAAAPAPEKAAKPAAVQAHAAKAAPASKVRVLAQKYRAKGYTVTPALAQSIHTAAVQSGIRPEVAFGLVRTESAFRTSATSHVGAIGLTQLMPSTARWLEPGTTRSDLRDPDTNLRIGFQYLRKLIVKYDGNTRLALLAYNRGPGTVDRVLRRGGNPDNGYADMVLGRR